MDEEACARARARVDESDNDNETDDGRHFVRSLRAAVVVAIGVDEGIRAYIISATR